MRNLSIQTLLKSVIGKVNLKVGSSFVDEYFWRETRLFVMEKNCPLRFLS